MKSKNLLAGLLVIVVMIATTASGTYAVSEDEIEQEEIEGGEINLVPYLDIVTNLMLFMLASVAAGFVLGQINTTLPKHAPSNSISPTKPGLPNATLSGTTASRPACRGA